MTAIEAVNHGMDQINHLGFVSQRDGKRAKQLIDVLREHHTVIDPKRRPLPPPNNSG
jgi:hypothetical protein